ncbi:MAG TPA: response regulator [Syntrophales bacterium]|jgi:response regulator RpfG family c-di-GMP phosphodiesterase|nr:response regulator [Syntrophales bacterium]HON22188.1 response regulator [Syntrophales bacterium]HOU77029.1 response regulator [Syntrophales bacterium]HPC32958.1 response regulator [Syntrophales bacterium]HQJ30744.1 response regulator [Syntrophales bacterium]
MIETKPLMYRKPRILCVDDEPAGHVYMEAILAPQGYELIDAHSGREALEILQYGRVDLVLLDIAMPDMDGYEVCRRIKMDERLVNIPVVMLTGLQTKEARIKSIEAGAEDFLQKLQNQEEVSARVRMLLNVKFLNERLANSFQQISNLTAYVGDIIRQFDPLRFDFMANIDGLVRQMIRKTADMVDKPLLMIVGLRLGEAPWQWHHYEYVFGEMIRMSVPVGISLHTDTPADRKTPQMIFFNEQELPKPALFAELQKLQTINIRIDNAVCYLSGELCIFALNYGRNVNKYDAAVLENMVVQSRFLRSLAAQIMEVEDAFAYMVRALARAAEATDEDSGNHVVRIGEYCAVLSERLGLDKEFTAAIKLQATLHDVGKIFTPSAILKKRENLSREDWLEIKKHPVFGAKIIGAHPRLLLAQSIALNHHELWDGSGYPRGLKGNAIPIEARIANLADQYDTLRIQRTHKPALDHETACRILNQGDGRTMPRHFDPQVLRAFRETAFLFEEIYRQYL